MIRRGFPRTFCLVFARRFLALRGLPASYSSQDSLPDPPFPPLPMDFPPPGRRNPLFLMELATFLHAQVHAALLPFFGTPGFRFCSCERGCGLFSLLPESVRPFLFLCRCIFLSPPGGHIPAAAFRKSCFYLPGRFTFLSRDPPPSPLLRKSFRHPPFSEEVRDVMSGGIHFPYE